MVMHDSKEGPSAQARQTFLASVSIARTGWGDLQSPKDDLGVVVVLLNTVYRRMKNLKIFSDWFVACRTDTASCETIIYVWTAVFVQ